MKKFLAVLLMFGFSQAAEAQNYDMQRGIVSSFKDLNYQHQHESPIFNPANSREPVERYKKTRNTGRILTGAGVGAVLLGGIMASQGTDEMFSTDNGDKMGAGFIVMTAGMLSAATGITMWTIGGIKHNKAKKSNLSIQQTSPTSAGLVYKF